MNIVETFNTRFSEDIPNTLILVGLYISDIQLPTLLKVIEMFAATMKIRSGRLSQLFDSTALRG